MNSGPTYLAVAIDTPLRRVFDYLPASGMDPALLRPGMRLWVPFGRRRTVGVLLGLRSSTPLAAEKIRRVIGAIDDGPSFDPVLMGLLVWSADYYRHPVGEVLAAALPLQLREGMPLIEKRTAWRLTELGAREALSRISPRAVRQLAVVHALQDGMAETGTLANTESGAREALRTLERLGYVEQIALAMTPANGIAPVVHAGHELTDAQAAAVGKIGDSLGRFHTWLLHGVTGSGKTEVYLRAIESVLRRGQQALVLVPEISLTPQLLGRFAARFTSPMAVLHSSLGDAERLSAWRAAREGSAAIVIGTRSAVFAPLARPGLIVVDEEHDPSYKQQEGFRYSARDLAIARAQRHGIPVVLGSATPSLESMLRVQRQPEDRLLLAQRTGNAGAPTLQLVDLRRHGQTQGLSTPVMLAIRRHLDAQGQVLLYLNRRGYAPVLFCPGCGWSAPCRRCDAHLTVHRLAGKLVCHHCGLEQAPIEVCPSCGSPVKPVGQGTERIEETIAGLYPDAPLARIDRDSMRRKGELEEALARVQAGEVRILVGTQMLTKGHHFPQVTLVVVLNADQGLFGSDFRASERLAQTIIQVAGRAGRADRPGEVLIQTEYPEHPLLQRLLTGDYEAFAQAALQEREQAHWPPFARIALLRAEATSPLAPIRFLEAALACARTHPSTVRLLGPAPAPMNRRAGRYRAQLLLRASGHAALQNLLGRWLTEIEALPEARRVRWSVDVDPAELF